jgi:hypothetical protein
MFFGTEYELLKAGNGIDGKKRAFTITESSMIVQELSVPSVSGRPAG